MATSWKALPGFARVAAAVGLGALMFAGPARAGFTIQTLGQLSTPGSSMGYAIGSGGQTAGTATVGSFTQAFYNPGASIGGLGTLGGNGSEAFGINSGGVVVGDSLTVPNGSTTHAFMSGGSGGALIDLGVGTGQYAAYSTGSTAAAVNDGGVVAGTILGFGGTSLGGTWTAANQFHGLPGLVAGGSSAALGINSAGQTTGWAEVALGGPQHAFRSSGATLQDLGTLPGFLSSRGDAINRSGDVVGAAVSFQGTTHAFIAVGPTLTDMTARTSGISGLSSSEAFGVNAADIAVGTFGAGSSGAGGFIWDPVGKTMYDLNNLVAGFGPGVDIIAARGINDSNQVVGTAIINNVTYGVLLTPIAGQDLFSFRPVPEPSSWLLLIVGAAGAAGYRKLRLRRARTLGREGDGRADASPGR